AAAIYTLSLHDALPILGKAGLTGPAFFRFRGFYPIYTWAMKNTCALLLICLLLAACGGDEGADSPEQAATNFLEALQAGDREDRSEEHTSELQSRENLV